LTKDPNFTAALAMLFLEEFWTKLLIRKIVVDTYDRAEKHM